MTIYRTYTVENARVEARDGSSSTALAVKSITITLDSTWSPYCQATLTCVQPSGAALTAIEPRADAGLRVRFLIRQQEPGKADVTRNFDLGLRSRNTLWTARQMTLEAATDEALWQDWAAGTDSNNAPNTVDTLIALAANRMGWNDGTTFQRLPNTTGPNVALEDGAWAAGTTGWDFCSQMAEAGGFRLWCAEDAIFRLAPGSYLASTTEQALTDAGTILDVADTVSRDNDWANYAVVTYSGNSPAQSVYAGSGASARKTLNLQRTRRKPAGNAATKVLNAAQQRGRNLDVRAVAEVAAGPLQTWRATYGDQSWAGLTQRVSFDFPTGVMQLLINTTSN